MQDMLRIARDGVEIVRRAPVPLLVGGLAWTALNAVTKQLGMGPFLVGPALYGLFVVALKALRSVEPRWHDAFAAHRDPVTSVVAGLLFALPFSMWGYVDDVREAMEVQSFGRIHDATPVVPLVATLSLVVFSGVYVFVFAFLADGVPRLADAVRRTHEMAELPGRPGSRVSGLGRQLAYASILPIGLLTWRLEHGIPYVACALGGPAVIALLAAWYEHRTAPAATLGVPEDGAATDVETSGGDGDD